MSIVGHFWVLVVTCHGLQGTASLSSKANRLKMADAWHHTLHLPLGLAADINRYVLLVWWYTVKWHNCTVSCECNTLWLNRYSVWWMMCPKRWSYSKTSGTECDVVPPGLPTGLPPCKPSPRQSHLFLFYKCCFELTTTTTTWRQPLLLALPVYVQVWSLGVW